MKGSISTLAVGFAIAMCGTFFACSHTAVHYTPDGSGTTVTKHHHHGPPPHAPAHGYRHKHEDGIVLVFESPMGLYVVSGHTDHYFHKNKYYRWRAGTWQRSSHFGGPWKKVTTKKLPHGLKHEKLKKEKKEKHKKEDKGKKEKKDKKEKKN